MRIKHSMRIGLMGLLAFGTCGYAAEIIVTDAWVRAVPLGGRVTAGFATVSNPGSVGDAIIGIEGEFAKQAAMHNTVRANGMAGMEPVSKIDLASRQSVRLEPGGLHVMFRHVDPGELLPGATVPLTFHFQHAPPQRVEAVVRSITEELNTHHH